MRSTRPIRWLIASVAAAVPLAVGGCVWTFEDNIVRFLLNPREPFQTASTPPPPDYALEESWAVAPRSASVSAPAVFLVHSTTYYERTGWNAPAIGSSADIDLERIALPNEAGPFMTWADVYAPRYRQATLFARFTLKFEGLASHERAYTDVRRAFLAFIDRIPADQPILLAGYGQGGLHVLGLIAEFFKDTTNPFVERLAVAYVIGHPTPTDFLRNQTSGVTLCEDADAVRCLVSYVPHERGHEREIDRVRRHSISWGRAGRLEPAGEPPLVCVNPLNWRTIEEYVGADAHIGAASATGIELGRPPAAVSGAVGAACDRGILMLDRPKQGYLRRNNAFGAKWKAQPYNLFFHDLTENGRTRVQNLLKLREIEAKRVDPIIETVEIVDSPINRVPSDN